MATNAPVYEEIQLERHFTKTAKPEDVQKGKSFKDVREYVESKKPGAAKEGTSTKRKGSTYVTRATVVCVLSVIALCLVAVVVLASYSHVQVENLKTTIEELQNRLNQTQLKADTVQELVVESVNSLQSSVNTLTTRVNSPVNLYQNCIQETRSCIIDSPSSSQYWATCYTVNLPINVTVSARTVLKGFMFVFSRK